MLRFILGGQPLSPNKNTRLTLALQPLFSIPYFLYYSFSSLYMMQLGLSPSEIGLINSVSFITKTIVAVFAGSIINFIGRKLSVVLFDALSWLVPLLLWAVATNFWYFLIAGIINSVVVINGMAVQFYLVEDNDDRSRIICFNLMDSINIMAGLLVPLTGILIKQYTLIPTMRGIYIFGFACLCIIILIKSLFLTETTTGQRLKGKAGNMREVFANIRRDCAYLFRKAGLMALMAVSILTNFGLTITSIFLFPYLTAFMGIAEKDVAVFPFISSAATIVILLFIMPRVKNVKRLIKPGLFAFVAAVALLILPIPGNTRLGVLLPLCLVIVYTVLSAAAKALFSPVIQMVIAAEVDDDVRANVMGVSTMISTLVMFPAGIIGGFLYEQSPLLMFAFIILVHVAALTLFFLCCKRSLSFSANGSRYSA